MILTTLYHASAKTPIVGMPGREICSVLSSSRSDGSIIYINSMLLLATCTLIQHQVRPRCRLTASTTWISHLAGAGFGAQFEGMTRSESPSLHAILEKSPSEDDLASSEGESYGSPLLRACNMVILVRAYTPTPPSKATPASHTAAARL
jgi:hypothetical protein